MKKFCEARRGIRGGGGGASELSIMHTVPVQQGHIAMNEF
jgi:hypothetical protein